VGAPQGARGSHHGKKRGLLAPFETGIAVAGVPVDGAVEADGDVAGIADVEIPVGRRVDYDHPAIFALTFVDLEATATLLPADGAGFHSSERRRGSC